MYGRIARHNPEQFFALPMLDDDSATSRYSAPAPRYEDANDGDALAFFSLAADDCGPGE